ncbi:MAG TPA: ATP-binding protein, partial [Mycobacteriales bacterium]|nr:ATP-binding protein [Mycobacteriales bacterium]
MSAVLDYLPRGNTLSDEEWHRRHRFLQWILAGHLPALAAFGLLRGFAADDVAESLALPLACLIVGHLLQSRRLAAGFITLGLVYCSAALVGFSNGAIEAHFHFFVMIGFIALYQDWFPFLLNIGFTVLSHGIGSSLVPDLMFNHTSAQEHPWQWSLIHGVAVLAACVGVVVFWKSTEDEQSRSLALTKQLADAEIGRRRFTSDLLVNLARRNQNLLYRQLDLLNELEDKERDPDALANLFRLDHLATRIRRNAESLLVLSGEDSPRTWREPVQLVDVIRAAIAEIEDLDRVDDAIDETLAVSGRTVADLTHLFAELLENAVHFSPPGVTVVVRSRPVPASPGVHLVTVEDWGVGMTPQELAEANEILRAPREVDLSVSQRLGLHVVARLAHRYGITVELTPTPGGGVTAVAVLPPVVFERTAELVGAGGPALNGYAGAPAVRAAGGGVGVATPPAGTPVVRGSGGPGAVNGAAALGGRGGLDAPGRPVPPLGRPGGATRADGPSGPGGIAGGGPAGMARPEALISDAPGRPAVPVGDAPGRPAVPVGDAPGRPATPVGDAPARAAG